MPTTVRRLNSSVIAEVDRILSYIDRRYSNRELKAALLWRSRPFRNDLAQLSTYFKHKARAREAFTQAVLEHKKLPRTMAPANATLFFKNWDIAHGWDGKEDSLSEHISAGVRVWSIPPGCGIPRKPLVRRFIEIDQWTTKKQITEAARRCQLGIKQRINPNLSRDLCWYDLYALGLKYAEISQRWAERRPKDLWAYVRTAIGDEPADEQRPAEIAIDYQVPQLVRDAVKRLQQAIDGLTAASDPEAIRFFYGPK